ncbi:GIY-YIG nuclease family protein [Galbibacter sp. BG1]|uniref:GIY-YIG nuclease family protein n=1 Tax=Galbibacter sp. BG1 TaxID=1170699 RepID=UPI0015BB23B9|nr:GIY-YIG nuclease family protein [Galbibacter sp. BG1]QLE02347.1 GIY-YIG nuclease family protein [Galbibacter sp. BG1]
MKIYYVYILQCKDDSYYIGITSNLLGRIVSHNEGKKKDAYTYTRRPVELKWFAEFTDVNLAIKKEKQLKGWSRRKKKALIEEDWDRLIEFSRNYKEFGNGSPSTPEASGQGDIEISNEK